MIKRYVTFGVGTPLAHRYFELEAENVDIILKFMYEHFIRDFCSYYTEEEFIPQIKKYELKLIHKGWIEDFDGKLYWHEQD